MLLHQAEAVIKRVLSMSPDSHNIFTPLELCEEIVSKIPSLDGNILVVANLEFLYTMITNGVKKENLYFATPCEIKKRAAGAWIPEENVFLYETVVSKEDVNGMKFDVVIGNPPYSVGNVPGGKNTVSSPLWYSFVEIVTKIVKVEGYIAFITPLTWIQKTNRMHSLIVSNKIIHAKVFSKSPFGPHIGTTVSYWVIQKGGEVKGIPVHFDKDLVDLSLFKFVPTKADNIQLRMSILNRTLNTTRTLNAVIIDTHYANQKKDIVRATKDLIYKYPVYNTHTASHMWSRIRDDLHGTPKVILPYTGTTSRAVVDVDRSVTERAVAFPTNTIVEAHNLLTAIQSKLFKFIIESVRSNATIARSVFRSLPPVDLTHSWTDEDLYNHFKLTKEEINLIETTIK